MNERTPSETPNAVISRLGEKEAIRILERKGYTNIMRRGKNETGFDLKADRDGRTFKFEVKTTTGEYSIPDAYSSEFDLKDKNHPALIADYLLVVRANKTENGYSIKGAHLLPRELVNRFQHRIKLTVVLSRDLQNILKDSGEYWIDHND